MKLKKFVAILTAVLMLSAIPVLSLAEADFGSAAVTEGQTYTMEQMLTYAIQDEYMAQAEYALILEAYGDNNAFANIIKAEETHIAELVTLFNAYGFEVPQNTAAERATLPASLQEAYETGVTAEVANIAMYESFLADDTLPQAVRDTFTDLQNASESHLEAFTKNAEKDGQGMGYGRDSDTQGQGQGQGSGDTQGQGQGQGSGDTQGQGQGQGGSDTQGQGKNRRTDSAQSDETTGNSGNSNSGNGNRYSDGTGSQTNQGTGDCDGDCDGNTVNSGNGNRYSDGTGSQTCQGTGDCDGSCDESQTTQQQRMGGHRANDD